MKIEHKFREHEINPDTKMLIIGTFNPDVDNNKATFFYGRDRNFLWSLLPKAFNKESLKKSNNQEKLEFIKEHNIDFVDLISEIEIDEGQENNYGDDYIDKKVTIWNDIVGNILKKLNIKEVYFTRTTFSNIPNMERKINKIEQFCEDSKIKFECLLTPARFENEDKLNSWKKSFGKDYFNTKTL